jgi:hypothetical protein
MHIIFSVGLLGDSAGFLAVAIRSASIGDPRVAAESYEILNVFSLFFGIPLVTASLITGLTLGIGSKWGVFRYPWVVTKLLLNISVAVVGTFVIGPAENALLEGARDGEAMLIAGASWDVLALTVATVLSVFKPGKRRGKEKR